MIFYMFLTDHSGYSMENRWLEGILADRRAKTGTSQLLRSPRSYRLEAITASYQHQMFIDRQLCPEPDPSCICFT